MPIGNGKPQRFGPNTPTEKEETRKRIAALKDYKRREAVIVGDNIRAIFLRAEGTEAIVRVGSREMKVSPMSLTRPPLKE